MAHCQNRLERFSFRKGTKAQTLNRNENCSTNLKHSVLWSGCFSLSTYQIGSLFPFYPLLYGWLITLTQTIRGQNAKGRTGKTPKLASPKWTGTWLLISNCPVLNDSPLFCSIQWNWPKFPFELRYTKFQVGNWYSQNSWRYSDPGPCRYWQH